MSEARWLMAILSRNSRELEGVSNGTVGAWPCCQWLATNISLVRRIIIVAVHANRECNRGGEKRQMDSSLLFIRRQGLAGRPLGRRPVRRAPAGARVASRRCPSCAGAKRCCSRLYDLAKRSSMTKGPSEIEFSGDNYAKAFGLGRGFESLWAESTYVKLDYTPRLH
jgi:hypothetical protein